MSFFCNLNLNLKILNSNFSIPKYSGELIHIFKLEEQDLNSEFVLWYKKNLGIPNNIQLFYTPPNWINRGVHLDGTNLNEMWAINQVVNNNEVGVMKWFRPNFTGKNLKTNVGGRLVFFDYNDVEEICEHKIKNISLVHIGIPHSVHNPSDDPRWCISVRPLNYNLSFTQAMQKIQNLNL